MVKQIMEKNESVLPNNREMKVLKQNFPSCFNAEGSFDIERFKEFLKDKVNVTKEGYELKFLGKNYARLLASVDTTTVIVPDEENNDKPENKDSENIYITGDNLDALKHLLQSYSGKVKCIYIDPPYNTGSDGFVYNDRFNFTAEDLAVKLSIEEEQAERILDLTKRGSASHSAWLMFMYPRLLLARDLLSEDGVIFISIDDNEQANLKLLCDDVFGEQNFVALFPWRKRSAKSDVPFGVSQDFEWLCCYGRSEKLMLGTCFERKYYSTSDYPDDRWRLSDLTTQKVESDRPNSAFDLVNPKDGKVYKYNPNRLWGITKDTFSEYYNKGKIVFPGDYDFLKITIPAYRVFESEDKQKAVKKYGTENAIKVLSTVLPDNVGMTEDGNKDGAELLGVGIFPFPKPVKLIEHIVNGVADDNFIVLDFFSGSATTAHAVMQLNAEDGGKRKFIMVQLPEQVKAGSEAEKAGYKSIDEIGRERIRRAAAKIKAEHPDTMADLGFKHYVLQEPQGETLDKLENFVPEEENGAFLNNDIFGQFGLPTILTTWLVRDGYGLNAKPQELDFAGYKGYYIGQHLYLVEEGLTDEAVTAIVAKFDDDRSFNPDKVVIFGYNFLWTKLQALKDNLARLKDTEKNIRIVFDVRY